MRARAVVLGCIAAFLLVGSMAAAQTGPSGAATPVVRCSQQCNPRDADVNGPNPRTGDEPVKTILYAHVQDFLNRAPLNTQPPGAKEKPVARSFVLPSVGLDTPVQQANVHLQNNQFHMFSSSGLVEVVGNQWRTHQEPGLAEDVRLVGDEITLYWYLRPDANTNLPEHSGGAMASVAIHARIETGRHPNSEESLVIAEGDTADRPATLVSLPGDETVWEFQVPLQIRNRVIPSVWSGSEGFIVTVTPYQIEAEARPLGSAEFLQTVQAVASPATPPRLIVTHERPLVATDPEPTVTWDQFFVRWPVASPWGAYDVDDASFQAELRGPGGIPPDAVELVIIKRSLDCDGHFKPAVAVWAVNVRQAGLPDGLYTLDVSVLNRQNTYRAEGQTTFQVVDGRAWLQDTPGLDPESVGVPGLGSLAILGVLGVAGLAVRRRHN